MAAPTLPIPQQVAIGEKLYTIEDLPERTADKRSAIQAAVEVTVTKVTSTTFKTDDGWTWNLNRYFNPNPSNPFESWKLRGGANYHGTYIRRGDTSLERMSRDEYKARLTAHSAAIKAKRNNALRASIDESLNKAIISTAKANSFGGFRDLRAALTEDEQPLYTEALEEALRNTMDRLERIEQYMKHASEQVALALVGKDY